MFFTISVSSYGDINYNITFVGRNFHARLNEVLRLYILEKGLWELSLKLEYDIVFGKR